MVASLDHSMHFYEWVYHAVPLAPGLAINVCSSCDPSEWLLFIMEAQGASNGRGLVRGRIYTRDGRLAVVVQQEGVVRKQTVSKL